MESWAEKYRPENLSDIIGNTKVISDLKTWANSWGDKMVKKGVYYLDLQDAVKHLLP